MIWIVFAAMTAAVIAALLLPVLKRGGGNATEDRNAYDRAVFRDQLAELDRDLERGVIGPAEAEAARNEISRRIIQAAGQPRHKHVGTAPAAVLLGVLQGLTEFLPISSTGHLTVVEKLLGLGVAEQCAQIGACVLR